MYGRPRFIVACTWSTPISQCGSDNCCNSSSDRPWLLCLDLGILRTRRRCICSHQTSYLDCVQLVFRAYPRTIGCRERLDTLPELQSMLRILVLCLAILRRYLVETKQWFHSLQTAFMAEYSKAKETTSLLPTQIWNSFGDYQSNTNLEQFWGLPINLEEETLLGQNIWYFLTWGLLHYSVGLEYEFSLCWLASCERWAINGELMNCVGLITCS